MSSFGVTKCDRCGLEIRVEYGVSYQTGTADDPETKIVRIKGYEFCVECAEPILKGLAEVLDEMKRDRRKNDT